MSTPTLFCGITLGPGRHGFTYAALDEKARLEAIGEGPMEAVLAFAAGQTVCWAALNMPVRPNLGILQDRERWQSLFPNLPVGRRSDFRLAEYQLRQMGYPSGRTSQGLENCSARQKRGFVLCQQLHEFGYEPYPAPESSRTYVEAAAEASFWALLGQKPFVSHSLEGRLQRQLVLYENGLDISDPMNFFEEITRHRLLKGILPTKDIFSSEELDALVCAMSVMRLAHHPANVMRIGDAVEGEIILPINPHGHDTVQILEAN